MRLGILISLFALCPLAGPCQVVINEIMYENHNGLKDIEGDTPDWIELFNTDNHPIDLTGWGLSDNVDKPLKWKFPEVSIAPYDFLIVYASGKNIADTLLHAGFKLKLMYEPVLLSTPDGAIVDHFEPQCVPADRTTGRQPDGSAEWKVFVSSSPGSSNNMLTELEIDYRPDHLSSDRAGGFFNEPVLVSLQKDFPQNKIYFTRDGSEPDESSEYYTSPIMIRDRTCEENHFSEIETRSDYEEPHANIFKATALRAVVYSDGCPASGILNETFFVHKDMSEKYPVPLVSIMADPDDLFSEEEGIYVQGNHSNSEQTGSNWERTVHLEIYSRSGEKTIGQYADARIHGRGTRRSAQKSLKLSANDKYGPAIFNYPLFADRDLTAYSKLLLRNSFGDWNETLFTDLLCHELVKEMNMDYMAGVTSVVFINGEYWGIQNIRELQDENYLQAHHPVSSGIYDIIDYEQNFGALAKEGTLGNYNDLIGFLMVEDPASDEYFRRISEMIDIDNMIDYFIAEMYLGNIDFPDINQRLWRDSSPGGIWRWLFFDCDACFQRFNYDHLSDYFNEAKTFERYPEWSVLILTRLLRNEEFRKLFFQRFYVVMNTVFSPPRVIGKIDSLKEVYRPLLAEHIERWHDPADIHTWLRNIEKLKQFAIGRPVEITEQLLKYYGNPVNVYPNPVSDRLFIESEMIEENEFILQLFDCTGRLVYNTCQRSGSSVMEIPLPGDIRQGVYILNIQLGYLNISEKIVILDA